MANNISIDADFVINEQPDIQADLHINFIPDISNLVTREELAEDLADKQDTLTAGANITIENNVISATDTTYTAGEGISIVGNVISNTQTSAEWGNIEGDITDQTDLIDLIDTKIDIEATARENNDLLLQNGINTLNDDLTAEISNRGTADGILQDNIDTLSGIVTSNYTTLDGKISDNKTAIDNHIANKTNPHDVTKSQVGLGNVDNTSDLNKPISTATQNALNTKVSNTREINGYSLSSDITLTASDVDALPDTTTIDDLTTAEQQSALNSGANTTNIGQIATNTNDIEDIEALIPNQATSSNQLADKDFVNSSIATNTANFIGTFESVTGLESYSGTVTNNDYAFVINSVVTDNGNDWATFSDLDAYDKDLLTNFDYGWVINGSNFDLYRFDILNQEWVLRVSDTAKASVTLNTAYNRYKATISNSVVSWEYEYTLNNSSFTASQWEAINSGITSGLVTQIGTNQSNISTINGTTINGNAIGNGNITLTAGDVGALPDSTTIGNGTLTIQKNGSTIDTFGANDTGNTTVNITVPTDTSDLTNNAGFITGINSTDVTTALGYTPYDNTNPDGYTDNVGTVTSVNNTQPDAYGNVSISIPAAQVNSDWNATSGKAQILNKPNLSTVATSGSYNDLSNKPTIPTTTSDLINDSGFITGITSSDVTTALGYTPYNSSNPSGYTSNVGTVTSVNNTSPDANGNVTLSIPQQVQPNWNETDTSSKAYIQNKPSLSTVATSGNYNDLSNKPTIPAAQVQANWNETDTSSKAYIQNKPTIPTVGNGTITITQGGTTKGTFTTNQSGNTTIDLDAGGGSSTDVQINGTSITSGGVADIVTNTAYNASSNKIATMSDLPSVANMQTTTNLVTSLSASSTDTQYPSAKCVYDIVGDIETLLSEV